MEYILPYFSHVPHFKLDKFRLPEEAQSLHVSHEYNEKVQHAFDLLAESATHLNSDALYTLGDMNFFGNYTHKQDFPRSLDCYKTLASMTGNSTAQFMVGLMYSTGMFGSIPINQAKANLYYTYAAEAHNHQAQMAMGFRHLQGIGTPISFENAVKYYKDTADKAFTYFFSGEAPGGRYLARPSWIIPNDDGGIYGEGASYVSSGHLVRHDFPSGVRSVEEAIEYFHYLAEENSVVYAHFALAVLYYEGGKTLEPNFKLAVEYAKQGAAYVWKSDGSPTVGRAKLKSFARTQGAHCAGFIGARYLGGQGVPQDFEQARVWFLRGIEFGDYLSYNSLGFMYYHGIGVEKDLTKGVEYIKKAVDLKYGPAHFNLGYAYFQRNHPGDAAKAFEQFDLASKRRNFPAWYYKGTMLYNGFSGKEKSLEGASIYFKIVSEAVEELHSPLKWAHDKFAEKDYGSAILGFLIAAEQGYETAQMNVAYLLDEQRGFLDLTSLKQKTLALAQKILPINNGSNSIENNIARRNVPREKTALVYWTRAARQLNLDAMVKMGDYYFNGLGTGKSSPSKAAACYQAAADYPSSLAKWNLGWMHENGIGAEQSFHLAKRYYDLAAAATPEAFFPVQLSLLKLRIRSFWSSLIHDGPINRIAGLTSQDDDSIDDSKSAKSFREGLVQMWRYWRDTTPARPEQKHTEDSEMESRTSKTLWDDEKSGSSSSDDNSNYDDSLDSMVVFAVLTIFGAFMWYRQRQQVRLQQELQRRVEEQRQRQEDGNNDQELPEQPPQDQNNNNRFMFQAGDGWVGFQFRAGF